MVRESSLAEIGRPHLESDGRAKRSHPDPRLLAMADSCCNHESV